ncbi:MAG: VCBS repeat-containing protein, partial [Candidatus Aminicenantes bacterium]|nr:VCBS repeat-containing protein [Candidatus Aminicenantes bacterium]
MKKPELRLLRLSGGTLFLLLFLAFPFRAQVPPACDSITDSFAENFNTDEYKNRELSSVARWPTGPITLNRLGANFDILQPAGMGAQIYVCAPGDFDGDGRTDLIGFDIGGGANRLILVRNQYEDADLDGEDDDGVIFQIDPSEVYDQGFTGSPGPAAITAGDYDGDGLMDFFFMKDLNDDFVHNDFEAAMYLNHGTAQNPHFAPRAASPHTLNFRQRFMDAGIYINWAGNHLASVDIDKDGDLDILAISQNRIFLMRNPGAGDARDISRWDIRELRYNARTGFTAGR